MCTYVTLKKNPMKVACIVSFVSKVKLSFSVIVSVCFILILHVLYYILLIYIFWRFEYLSSRTWRQLRRLFVWWYLCLPGKTKTLLNRRNQSGRLACSSFTTTHTAANCSQLPLRFVVAVVATGRLVCWIRRLRRASYSLRAKPATATAALVMKVVMKVNTSLEFPSRAWLGRNLGIPVYRLDSSKLLAHVFVGRWYAYGETCLKREEKSATYSDILWVPMA